MTHNRLTQRTFAPYENLSSQRKRQHSFFGWFPSFNVKWSHGQNKKSKSLGTKVSSIQEHVNKRKQSKDVVTFVRQVWIPKCLISMLNDLKGQGGPKQVWVPKSII